MPGIVWRNSDLRTLRTHLSAQKQVAIDAAEQIVTQSVEEGAELQREFLDRATTEWGERRYGMGRGQSSGRRDTDEMYSGIDSRVELDSRKVTGRFGWFNVPNIGKFLAQEWGGSPSRIPPAHDLLDAFERVRIDFIKRCYRLIGR